MVSADLPSLPPGDDASTVVADSVLVEVRGRVARILLNDPGALNAVDERMLNQLAAAIEASCRDDRVRAVVLTGAGRGFCAGARLSSDIGQSLTSGVATLELIERIIVGLTHAPIPIVAAVNGVAAGVGLSFALACDYVLAADTATFMLSFNRIGLLPDGAATALVAANIGRARALRMALTCESVDAATALEWGLISERCPAADLPARTEELTTQLANSAAQAVAATTRAINRAALGSLDDVLAREAAAQTRLLGSEDFREGVQAFRDKRPAQFEGR